MPAMKHYLVDQTRQIKVWANDEAGALAVANSAFTHGQDHHSIRVRPGDVAGNAISQVEITEVKICRN